MHPHQSNEGFRQYIKWPPHLVGSHCSGGKSDWWSSFSNQEKKMCSCCHLLRATLSHLCLWRWLLEFVLICMPVFINALSNNLRRIIRGPVIADCLREVLCMYSSYVWIWNTWWINALWLKSWPGHRGKNQVNCRIGSY